jgi:ribonucleoside-diphosphate reductase alpha chain
MLSAVELSKTIMSDVVTHLKYAGYLDQQNRREVWEEICFRGRDMHSKRWPHVGDLIAEAFQFKVEKKVLSSMRAAQFAGRAIENKPNRIYNCAYLPMDSIDSIGELFYNLLCGSGVGYSVQGHHVIQLPRVLGTYAETQVFTIPDTIEGWCDAVKHLLQCYFQHNRRPVFDFSLIRPEGARLITSGGRAPGPKPLRTALRRIEKILTRAAANQRRLKPIEVHDICCHMADAVHAGGIRRAAMIAFFDRWDSEMLLCKSGDWYKSYADGGNLQRSRANNSAVFVRGEVGLREFYEFWEIVENNKTGEPAIYWTWDRDVLSNPCVEIALEPFGFCNLTTVNGSSCVSEQDFFERVRMAARIGTLQAGWTEFGYLRPVWQETAERDALLGVSITGIGEGVVQQYDLKRAAAIALAENERMSKLMGIRKAKRVTCVKPEGTGSLVLGTSQGIHAWEAPYYFKNIRIGKSEPIYPYLRKRMPSLVEDLYGKEDTHAILRMPVKANPTGIIRKRETALCLLNRVRDFYQRWVRPGHREGVNTHNISCTVNVKDSEWRTVGSWMWENKDHYNGIATFPDFDAETFAQSESYQQLPMEPCTEEQYHEALGHIKNIDLRDVIEVEDNTSLSHAVACAGGMCAI